MVSKTVRWSLLIFFCVILVLILGFAITKSISDSGKIDTKTIKEPRNWKDDEDVLALYSTGKRSRWMDNNLTYRIR